MADVQITPGSTAPNALRSRSGTLAWTDRITTKKVIIALAVLAAALRLYYLTRPGFLFGVTEYDDGSYLGSAIRLVQGQLPYRDFVFVQPPGITLLLVPVALVGKVAGTAWAMVVGRILTIGAGTAGVVLTGLLVRRRGVLAVLLACGICAVHPDSVSAAHTILVEPWLVLFCLIGAVAVFDGDRIATGRRLCWGGVAFGFAGAIESWAIVPVMVLIAIALSTRQVRRAAVFAGGVAIGFGVPTLPFAALAPSGFYRSVITAQVGGRHGATRIYSLYRIRLMAGLEDINHPGELLVLGVTAAIVILVVAAAVATWRRTGQPPSPLDWFAPLSGGLTAVLFLWPPQFHYHFVAFLVPFLALSVALAADSVARSVGRAARSMTTPSEDRRRAAGRRRDPAVPHPRLPGGPSRRASVAGRPAAGWAARPGAAMARLAEPAIRAARGATLQRAACVLIALGIAGAAVVQLNYERPERTSVSPAEYAAVRRVIPAGACVLADEVSYLVVADRFISDKPGCPEIDDGTGVNYALSGGLSTGTGAARVPAVDALWRSAFGHVQFIWLSFESARRVPWTPALTAYFNTHFALVHGLGHGIKIYRRVTPSSAHHPADLRS
jgi:Glycosyltransferase family 87